MNKITILGKEFEVGDMVEVVTKKETDMFVIGYLVLENHPDIKQPEDIISIAIKYTEVPTEPIVCHHVNRADIIGINKLVYEQ